MDRIEMVEKLREKANITIEEAKDLLEKNEWDLLNAMVDLEKNGKIQEQKDEAAQEEQKAETNTKKAEKKEQKKEASEKREARCHRLRSAAMELIHIGLDNKFIVSRNEEEVFKVPVIVPIVCAVGAFPVTCIALVAGLVLGFHYSFEGKELGKDNINKTMEKASETAESFVQSFAEKKTESAQEKEQNTENAEAEAAVEETTKSSDQEAAAISQ